MSLRAEILSIGDELTSGQRLDTNSQYLSQRLSDLGIHVRYHTTVGDEFSDNVLAFRAAAARAHIVIATGGLGPTADDLTREAISEAFSLPLEMRPEAMAHIESLFALRKRPMPERNRVQAMFPQTSKIIPNPHGTAPGIDLEVMVEDREPDHRCRLFALPGVPAEMIEMLNVTVIPRLVQDQGAGAVQWRYHTLKVFGIGESDVEHLLPDLIARDRIPLVGITVSKATITLRIAAQTASQAEFEQLVAPTIREIRDALGDRVFGEGEIELHEAVHQILDERSIRLGVIEVGASCRISHMLAKLQSHTQKGLVLSQWFACESELTPYLEQDAIAIPSGTEVTLQSALAQAAEKILERNDLDRCLAAGVYPTLREVSSAETIPYADFTMCLARRDAPTKTTTVSLGGHPDVLYHRLAKTGLNFLRLDLIGRDFRTQEAKSHRA
jgi:nicotinamide-nucleotide amidase